MFNCVVKGDRRECRGHRLGLPSPPLLLESCHGSVFFRICAFIASLLLIVAVHYWGGKDLNRLMSWDRDDDSPPPDSNQDAVPHRHLESRDGTRFAAYPIA